MASVLTLAGALAGCSAPADEPAEIAVGSGTVVPPVAEPARPVETVQRVTPVLAVEVIEPVRPFWENLGFTAINPAYRDGRVVFIAFVKDDLEIHYQTVDLIAERTPEATTLLAGGRSLVYVTVDDLDATLERLGGAEIVIPRRRTAWGADEIYVADPAGHLIGFASFD